MSNTNMNEVISELDRIASLHNERKSLLKSIEDVGREAQAESEKLAHERLAPFAESKKKKDAAFDVKRPQIPTACMELPPVIPMRGVADSKEIVSRKRSEKSKIL